MPASHTPSSASWRRAGARASERPYWPGLDGLRGLAVGLVLAYHAGWASAGWVGVDVFFVLSGFLITTLLLREHDQRGRVRLGSFYARRAVRLLPAAVTVIVGVVVAGLVLLPRSEHTALLGGALSGLFYVGNFRAIHPASMPLLGHLWSLSLEEQFYLTWPALLLVLLRHRVGRSRLAAGLGAAVLAATGWGIWLSLHGASPGRVSDLPDTHPQGLLLGCLLAVLASRSPRVERQGLRVGRRRVQWAAIVGGAGLLAFSHFGGEPSRYYTSGGYLLFSLAALALVAERVYAPSRTLSHVLEHPWLVWVGTVSYELYLIHLPVLRLLPSMNRFPLLLIGGCLSLALAALLHYSLRPLQAWVRRTGDVAATTAAARRPWSRTARSRSVIEDA